MTPAEKASLEKRAREFISQSGEYALAFKATLEDYSSIFARNPFFKRVYEVGSEHKTHEKLPMFLVKLEDEMAWLEMKTGHYFVKMLVVKVPKNNVTTLSPWFTHVTSISSTYTLNDILGSIEFHPDCHDSLCSNRLEVLEEVNMKKFANPQDAMVHFEKKYNLLRYN